MTPEQRHSDLAAQAIELLDQQSNLLGNEELSKEQTEQYRTNQDRIRDLILAMSQDTYDQRR